MNCSGLQIGLCLEHHATAFGKEAVTFLVDSNNAKILRNKADDFSQGEECESGWADGDTKLACLME